MPAGPAPTYRPVYKALHRRLTVWGVERRLFFLALLMGAATFNLFYSFLAGLIVFAGLYAFGLWATHRDPELAAATIEQPADRIREAGPPVQVRSGDVGIRRPLALRLHRGRIRNSCRHRPRVVAAGTPPQRRHRLQADDHVEPVAHRSRQSSLVATTHAVLARALVAVDTEPATGTRVVGGEQHEARGQRQHAVDPRDRHRTGVDWSAQRVEGVGAELERLVEEEDAPVRQARLSGPDARSSPDERLRLVMARQ